MSIALESNTTNQIQRSGFVRGMSFKPAIYDSPDSARFSGDRRPPARAEEQEADSCSSSSIGRNSDSGSSDGEDSGDKEVQSNLNGPLDCLEALEEVLPIKRGISSFYSGKSKSFTSLADVASCSTIKDIAKPEDTYTRKRKNLLAHNYFWDKNRNLNPKGNDGGISKRLANSSRSSSNLAVMMGDYANTICESSNSKSSSPSLCLPPLPPQGRSSRSPNNNSSVSPPTPRRNFSPWRSFSLSDLQQAAASTNPNRTVALIDDRRTEEDSH